MKYIHFFFCLLLGISLQAQIKIGDNPQNIDPSSVLELESSSRVLVITRVSTAQMNAITPSAGAMVYNTDIECIHYYTGVEWKNICDAVAGSITFTSDDATVVITSTGGNNYDLKVGEITGMNIVNETVFGADIATATIGERQLAPNSVGNSELQDNTVGKSEIQEAAVGTLEIIDGTIKPEDMEPGAFDQLLTTDATGNVVWLDKSELGSVQADQLTILGAGTTIDPLKVGDGAITTLQLADHSVTSIKIADNAVGTPQLANNSVTSAQILDGQVQTNDIANDGVTTDKILNANVTNDKLDKANISLSGFAAPTTDLSMGSNRIVDVADPTLDQDAATKKYVDDQIGSSNSLLNGTIFVGDATNTAQAVALSGDATIDNLGELTIADDAIDTDKILDANVTNDKLDKGNISLTGFAVPTTNLSMDSNKIIDVADPTLDQDAATKKYVDDQIGSSNSLLNGTIFVGDATNTAKAVALSGDATIDNLGELTIADDAVTTDMILNETIVNEDISINAAILGTKINPDFGMLNVLTTGTLTAGNTTITGTLGVIGQTTINEGPQSTTLPIDRGIAGQVLTTDGIGAASWAAPVSPFHALGKIDGTTLTLTNTLNVDNITGSTGNYTVEFTTDANSLDYIIQLTLGVGAGKEIQVTAQTEGSFSVLITDLSGTAVDSEWFFTVIDL